ncbi:GlxA family transcriptional regulator [Paraburkholderia bonniea]|uniref:GlxA family transcriptional regulator n=1 Tax=Paraburkholderia bonniea TaxID=2152891 RepID=UPI001290F2E1|nr:GlxA family transcriptional regulator [Paraburkholderia bonniea]WJF91510.1 GlxA family transcriptional regulator [Paraburkholderia bonniea]WJF94829.1 GlxA family transcriptional regulator [Paraburkholderia bonniea]
MSPERTASLSHFVFMPLPNFTLIAFSNAVEVLRMANYLSGQTLYRWTLVSPEGGPVRTSNGLSVDTLPADSVTAADIVFVCGGIDVQRVTTPQHLSVLRRFSRSGITLGSLCTGTYALARAGLLSGYACSIHWENLSALREEFPGTRFLKELFVIDRDRVTCTGGIAPLDMMLNLIAARVGTARITQIAEQFVVEHVRDPNAQQRMPLVARLGCANKSLFEVIALMENNIEEPLSREELARLAGMSQRQLQRLFREHLGMTPTHYYLTLRLRRSRELLLQTDMSIMHITMACGFQSACHFSKSYRDAYGSAPTRERRRQAAPLEETPQPQPGETLDAAA